MSNSTAQDGSGDPPVAASPGNPAGPPAGTLDAATLSRDLRTRRVGRRIICLDGTGSTNDDAFVLAARASTFADGTVVFAERQASGRGRQGRKWLSPRGASIQCSVLLCGNGEGAPLLALASGVATCAAIAQVTEISPTVRWPNDVFAGNRKLAGVLVERREIPGDSAIATVIGIGVNCLQQRGHFEPDLGDIATSLEIESRAPVDRVAVARALIESLDQWLGAPGGGLDARKIVTEWTRLSDDIGSRVTVDAGGRRMTGRILDVAPDASLMLQTDEGARMMLDAAVTSIVERHSSRNR